MSEEWKQKLQQILDTPRGVKGVAVLVFRENGSVSVEMSSGVPQTDFLAGACILQNMALRMITEPRPAVAIPPLSQILGRR